MQRAFAEVSVKRAVFWLALAIVPFLGGLDPIKASDVIRDFTLVVRWLGMFSRHYRNHRF